MPEIFEGIRGPEKGGCFLYSRHFNPTLDVLARYLAAMEGTEAAVCTASGMAAISTTMLTLLKNNAAQLDVNAADMDTSISRSREMLQSAVDIEILSASVSNGELEARIKVQNNSGHKTPTGYPSRRMWLNFKVTDSNNNVIFESGRINADGSIAGADNDEDATEFEPHYELITSADQVQIYESIIGDHQGKVTTGLLKGVRYLKDNRVVPYGFNKATAHKDVGVFGAARDDADFSGGQDSVTDDPNPPWSPRA